MIKPAILAIQFMTRLPLPAIPADTRDFARAIRWFPAAGLLVGLAVAAAAWLGLQRDPSLGALLALVAWIAITGALHLDGLGDIADAAGAAHGDGLGDIADAAGAAHGDRDRLSAVLADPHIGSFGVVAIGLQLLAKIVLLHLAVDADGGGTRALLALIAVPMAARIGPLLWTRLLPPLHQGLGTTFGAGATWPSLCGWLLLLAVGAWWLTPALLAAPLAMALWAWWLSRRIGGISGDGHGAGIELVETATLAAWALLR